MHIEDEKKLAADQEKFNRIVSTRYFGYLVGQLRELVEATHHDPVQRNSLKGLVDEKLYQWWNNIGDKLTPEETEEVTKKHWESMDESGNTNYTTNPSANIKYKS